MSGLCQQILLRTRPERHAGSRADILAQAPDYHVLFLAPQADVHQARGVGLVSVAPASPDSRGCQR